MMKKKERKKDRRREGTTEKKLGGGWKSTMVREKHEKNEPHLANGQLLSERI